jgi:gluconolactonase
MSTFASELGSPEAPLFLPDGSLLCVEMSPDKGCVTQLSADGKTRRQLARTGRPNGLALDRSGAIWVAETAMRAVLRMTLGGECEVFASECRGEPFLFLNDLAFGPNGDLFVTDSGILFGELVSNGAPVPNYRDLTYDGRIYRIEPRTKRVEIIDRGFQFANGLAFGPDGHLYVNETLSGNIYRYACRNGVVSGKREPFGNVIEHFDPAQLKGPDGMKFGADGQLYVAVFGQGDITILNTSAQVARRIETRGMYPTNLAFGSKGKGKTIYVTEAETGTLQTFEVESTGFTLHG